MRVLLKNKRLLRSTSLTRDKAMKEKHETLVMNVDFTKQISKISLISSVHAL